MFRLLCCFFALFHLGWSANEYLFENNNRVIVSNHQTQHVIPQQQQHHYEQHSAPLNYKKEYFTFSAPEEKHDQAKALQKLTSAVKRRQQVIFIKNPVNNAYEKAVENLAQNAVQQKTHIYVLNKEPNYAGLRQKFQSIQKNIQHKPEVKFLSYRTKSDADRIQSSIVQQYGGGIVKPLFSSNNVVHGNSLPFSKSYSQNSLPSRCTDASVVTNVPSNSYIPVF